MNKQIEEMADILCDAKDHDCKGGNDCLCVKQAEALYNAGYRKASTVAMEIFAEIEKEFEPTVSALFYISETLVDVSKSHIDEKDALNKIREYLSGTVCSKYRLRKMLAELKKKYESEGADDD